MAEVAASIAEDIRCALDEDALELPSLPEVALRIREEAESEFVSASSLSAVVMEDPGLAAQIVRVANSPMFRATRSIDDLGQAISRLGVDYAANMVTGLAMQQMFQATSELVDRKMRQVWQSATHVAGWSSILAKTFTDLRPDQATLAGLTHCIGILPILSWVEENEGLVTDSMTLDRVIDSIHPTIGTMILRHWNFADEIVAVPENYRNLGRGGNAPDYVDAVCTSVLFSGLQHDHPASHPEWQECMAMQRLGLSLEMDHEEWQTLIDQVDEVRNILS